MNKELNLVEILKDCPHLYTESTRCKGEKCKRIKKTLKEIL
jgi:hypothetical protein